MKQLLLSTLAALTLTITATAQNASVTFIPSYIVPDTNIAISVYDPDQAGWAVTVRVYDPAGGEVPCFADVQVILDEDGYGVGIWNGNVMGWQGLIASVKYTARNGYNYYDHKPIIP